MNLISRTPSDISISLSRRNLQTLLAMLDYQTGLNALSRIVAEDGTSLTVWAEEDAEHYASNDRQAHVRNKMGIGPDDLPGVGQ
jgi:hypothetical protein